MFPTKTLTIVLLTTLLITLSSSTNDDAYPSPYSTTCDLKDEVSTSSSLTPIRKEVYDNGRIIDISHRYHPEMPSWKSDDGLGEFLTLSMSMKKNGSHANVSEMKMVTHTGTHVDAPGHMVEEYFDAGFDVDTLDLHVLNGEFVISTLK